VRRARAVVAAAVVTVLVLAGCSGGSDDAAPKTTTTHKATTTTEPPSPDARWLLPPQLAATYRLGTTLDLDRQHEVAELRRVAAGTEGGAGIADNVTSKGRAGKTVTFSASLKVVGSGRAGLYLQVATEANPNQPTTIRTAEAELVGPGGWSKRALRLDIPKDATLITFGVALEGGGSVLIDDVKAP
jgi:hypothetical protein